VDYGNTALWPPACDLWARRDERHNKHVACRGAVNNVISQHCSLGNNQDCRQRYQIVNASGHSTVNVIVDGYSTLIDRWWTTEMILLGINRETHNSVCSCC